VPHREGAIGGGVVQLFWVLTIVNYTLGRGVGGQPSDFGSIVFKIADFHRGDV